MLTRIALALIAVVFISGCASRSAKPFIEGRSFTFKKNSEMNLVVYVRTMTGRPYSEDQATINLGWIYGTNDAYVQISCISDDKNLQIILSPALGFVNEHIEYPDGFYLLDLHYGMADVEAFSLPQEEAPRIGLFIGDKKRERQILETDTAELGTWYITSLATVKDFQFKVFDRVKQMKCYTIHRKNPYNN